MAIRFSELRLWIVAWLYALWLNGLTYVFYLTEGSASTELESALLLGSIPVIVQIWLLGIDKRGWRTVILFSLLFVLAILLSYVGNIESWMMWVFFFQHNICIHRWNDNFRLPEFSHHYVYCGKLCGLRGYFAPHG